MERAASRRLDGAIFAKNFLNSFDFVLTDCDGVLWMQDYIIPGAAKALQLFRDEGKKILYVSNFPKSRESYLEMFREMGFSAAVNEIYNPLYCCTLYLRSLQFQKKIYVICSSSIGLSQELERAGMRCLADGPDPVTLTDDSIHVYRELVKLHDFPKDPDVGAVLVCLDLQISYMKLFKAISYLKDPDVLYIATSMEKNFSVQGRTVVPGTGATVAAISIASGREPLLLGKPSTHMFECIKKEHPDIKPSRCLMIGDSREDILFGRNCGMQTLLVLSGATKMSHLEQGNPDIQADYFVDSLGDLDAFFQHP